MTEYDLIYGLSELKYILFLIVYSVIIKTIEEDFVDKRINIDSEIVQ